MAWEHVFLEHLKAVMPNLDVAILNPRTTALRYCPGNPWLGSPINTPPSGLIGAFDHLAYEWSLAFENVQRIQLLYRVRFRTTPEEPDGYYIGTIHVRAIPNPAGSGCDRSV